MKRRTTITTTFAKQAMEKLTEIDSQQSSNFQAAFAEFLRHCGIKGLSEHTVKYYDKELKQNARTFADIDAPLDDLRRFSAKHIEQFIEELQRLGRKVNTINSRLRASRTFFEFCLRKGYVDRNPHTDVELLRKRHEVGATLNKRQLKKLLDAPDVTTFIGLRDLAIMLTFAHTGIRLNELITLSVQDVQFDGKGAVNVQRAKNRFARRIPLTGRLKTVMRAYIQERGVLDHDALFISVENEPLGPRAVQDRLAYYGEMTSVSKEVTVNPHAFRRTFARLKVEAGTNIFVLQRLTGHQSLEVLKRYVEIYGKDLEDAIENGVE